MGTIDNTRPVLIIDGNMLAHRTFTAPDMEDLATAAGRPTGMEYGFLRVVERLQKEFARCDIFIAWDCKTAKSQRQKIAPEYKANRERSDKISGMYARVEDLRSYILRVRFYELAAKGLEADDIMYSYSRFAATCEHIVPHVFLYTNDHDLLQCVSERCTVLKSHAGSIFTWDEEKVFDKYKVRSGALPLYRAIEGDKSDNLPGCVALGKAQIATYCRAIYREGVPRDGLAQVKRFVEMANKARKRFTKKSWAKWSAFIKSGQLLRNFKCMRLVTKGYETYPPSNDNQLAAQTLAEMEIYSLNMSAELLSERDIGEDEF